MSQEGCTEESMLNKLRGAYVRNIVLTIVPVPVFILFCVITMWPDHEIIFPGRSLVLVVLLLGSFGMAFFYGRSIKGKRNNFYFVYKNTVVNKALKENFENFNYQPLQCISQSDISLLCSYPNFLYEGEDLITGTYRDVPYRQSDVHAYHYKSDGDGQRTTVSLLRGRFAEFPYPKSEGMSLIIAEKFFPYVNHQGMEQVYMENIAFMDKYDVYASTQQVAFYLLTPQVMEYILALGRKSKNVIRFQNGTVYVMRHGIDGAFEAKMNKKIELVSEINKAKADMQELLEIIDILKLS